MINSVLFRDEKERPDLFLWNGQLNKNEFTIWLTNNKWIVFCPDDLAEFWKRTGGGDVFETETILGPLSDSAMGDDIAKINKEMQDNGLPKSLLVFHIGLIISAFDMSTRVYVELAPDTFDILRSFSTLEEWYKNTLRNEYNHRYKLSPKP